MFGLTAANSASRSAIAFSNSGERLAHCAGGKGLDQSTTSGAVRSGIWASFLVIRTAIQGAPKIVSPVKVEKAAPYSLDFSSSNSWLKIPRQTPIYPCCSTLLLLSAWELSGTASGPISIKLRIHSHCAIEEMPPPGLTISTQPFLLGP